MDTDQIEVWREWHKKYRQIEKCRREYQAWISLRERCAFKRWMDGFDD